MLSNFEIQCACYPWHFSIQQEIITIKESFEDCTRYLTDLRTDILFFHGFFMTDKPIVHDMKNYRRTIKDAIGDAYSLNNSFVMDPGIFDTEVFLRYKEIFRCNLQKVTSMCSDFTVALENDFPLIGGGLQRPSEIHQLIDNLWFDLGHFWCASLVHMKLNPFSFFGMLFFKFVKI